MSPKQLEAQVAALQRVRDDELSGSAETTAARELFDRIVATETLPPASAGPARRGISTRIAYAVAAAVLIVAAIAVARVFVGGGLPDEVSSPLPVDIEERREIEYRAIPLDPSATPTQLDRKFDRLGFDIEVELVPASPLLVGEVISRRGDGAKQIRSLSRRCPRVAPCERFGLLVPRDFDQGARLAIGRAAGPAEPYLHVWDFQASDPHILPLVGSRVRRAAERASGRNGRRTLVFFDPARGRVIDNARSVGDWWVTDAIWIGPNADPKLRPHRIGIMMAVARRPVPAPRPFWMPERWKRYQQDVQAFGHN